MDLQVLANHDRTRNFSTKGFHSICYATHTSLYFDTAGNVRVCCFNYSHRVGNVATQSIREIWNGLRISELRRALEYNDLSRGCSYCEWRLSSGDFACLPISKWDQFPVPDSAPAWPKQMEFSISNTCNLQCVMCNGNASSSIRAHREKLPPLSNPYTDAFFEELRFFLCHLERARFLGGEPFLQENCYRIWDMLIEDSLKLPCHVTTNGTIYSSRVERILDNLPVGISISIDGFSQKTYESIRVNARYEKVLENLHRFRAYTLGRRTSFGMSYCLMRQNWHEFGDFCLFADSLNCTIFVNQVRQPPDMSLYTLEVDELKWILAAMEAKSASLLPKLTKNRQVWVDQLQSIRQLANGSVAVPGVVTLGKLSREKPVSVSS